MRLIDADELREDVNRTLNWNTNNEYNMYSDVMDMIDEAPTVEDADRKIELIKNVIYGEWLPKDDYSAIKLLNKIRNILEGTDIE